MNAIGVVRRGTCVLGLFQDYSSQKSFLRFRPRWRHRQTHGASSHNQKKDNNNLKTINNQNCQKIELYGNPTTRVKEETLTQTSRRAERTLSKVVAGGLGGPTFEWG